MADPFSIATGCAGLIFSVAHAIHKISKFVSDVRSARKDMDQVACQLMSLQLCLESLSGDTHKRAIDLPSEVRIQIRQTLLACEANVEQILEILTKAQSGRLGRRVQWAFSDSDDVSKIRSALESNKTALEIGLSIGTISLLTRSMKTADKQGHSVDMIVRQAESISISTTRIENKLEDLTVLHKDTTRLDTINMELVALRTHLGILSTNTQRNQNMKLFVDQARMCVSQMIKPMAVSLSHTSQNGAESLMRVVPIPPSPSANADPSSKAPSDSQEASSAESCPVCAGPLTESKQRDALTVICDRELAYAKELERHENTTRALQKEVFSLQKEKRGLEQKCSEIQHSITQKSSVALSARESRISELLLDLDQYRQGESEPWSTNPDDKSHFDSIYEFVETDSQGFITHEQAMQLFNEWMVPEDISQKIWKLADINSTGVLNRDEFAVAVYLARQQQELGGYRLPDVLPFRLVPPSMRKQQQLDQLVVHANSSEISDLSIYVAETSAVETERDRTSALKQRLQAYDEQLQVERAKREALESQLGAMQPLRDEPASPTPPFKYEDQTWRKEWRLTPLQQTRAILKIHSPIQNKVLEATSSRAGGPSQLQMKDIAALTYKNPVTFHEIVDILEKQLNAKRKEWRTVLKSLKILEFLLLKGSNLCCVWARKNIYVVETLREFIYVDADGRDMGEQVRVAAKELVTLILDDLRLSSQRAISSHYLDQKYLP